jgi:hypothetical protein
MAQFHFGMGEPEKDQTHHHPLTHGSTLYQILLEHSNRPAIVSLVCCQAAKVHKRKGNGKLIPACSGTGQGLLETPLSVCMVASFHNGRAAQRLGESTTPLVCLRPREQQRLVCDWL